MNIQQRLEDYIEHAWNKVEKIEDIVEKTTSMQTKERYIKQLHFYNGIIALGSRLLDELKHPRKTLTKISI